jgi:hypothetical protein
MALMVLAILLYGACNGAEEEVTTMVREGAERGIFEEVEHELIEGVFEFTDTAAREIMAPRVRIQADLAGQRLVNSRRIKTAQARVTDDDNRQRTQTHTHQFLHGLGIACNVLLSVRDSPLR